MKNEKREQKLHAVYNSLPNPDYSKRTYKRNYLQILKHNKNDYFIPKKTKIVAPVDSRRRRCALQIIYCERGRGDWMTRICRRWENGGGEKKERW